MTTTSKVIARFNDFWGDEVRILDIAGTLYREENGERTPMRFDVHDCGGEGKDGDVLSHSNVRLCGWEVTEDPTRNFCSTLCMPSDCFNNDIEQEDDLSKEAIQAIKDWAEDDLEEADKLCKENLKPTQAEFIVNDFSEWYEEQDDIMTDEEYAEDYLELVQRNERGYIPNFHDDDEILELCKNYLKK